jgi:hypothetical protein
MIAAGFRMPLTEPGVGLSFVGAHRQNAGYFSGLGEFGWVHELPYRLQVEENVVGISMPRIQNHAPATNFQKNLVYQPLTDGMI